MQNLRASFFVSGYANYKKVCAMAEFAGSIS